MERLEELIIKLRSTTKKNEKIKIISEYDDLKKIFYYTYNPYYRYNVTSKVLKKHTNLTKEPFTKDLFEFLDALKSRKISGYEATAQCNGMLKILGWSFLRILDKDLKCKTNSAIINTAFPGLIPEFKVSLCNDYQKYKDKIDVTYYLASRKMDGVRCIIRKENGIVKAFSRKGIEFQTLSKLKEEVERVYEDNFILDGEVCIMRNGSEVFNGIMKEIKRKDHTIKNPKMFIFDVLTLEEFDNQVGDRILTERLTNKIKFNNYFEYLEQQKIKSKSQIEDMMKKAAKCGWEGLILRKDVGYKGKRSSDLLKIKKFFDDEYKVIDIETGPYPISNSGGIEEYENVVTRVNILHKGNIVGVGSGFSLKQRREFFKDPSKIIGKIITVQYFEEIETNGEFSLRFPTIKVIHGEERDL